MATVIKDGTTCEEYYILHLPKGLLLIRQPVYWLIGFRATSSTKPTPVFLFFRTFYMELFLIDLIMPLFFLIKNVKLLQFDRTSKCIQVMLKISYSDITVYFSGK